MLNQLQKEKLQQIIWTFVAKTYAAHSPQSPNPAELKPEMDITTYYPIKFVGDEDSNRFSLAVSNVLISLNYYFKTNAKLDFSFRDELKIFSTLEDICVYFYDIIEKCPDIEAKI